MIELLYSNGVMTTDVVCTVKQLELQQPGTVSRKALPGYN